MAETKAARTVEGRALRCDWAQLTGRVVEVWFKGDRVMTGVVEQAAADDSVLWIAADGADPRKLFDQSTGYQMWV
ncbi:hypothetical protein ACIPY2_20385 [Paenarthrobacter sp. NPDC089675]|uniref:hypothetical protein n=1 Tax=Paenarthrobacter sp. NPDC089675 TaxID=3364376 RepID=UPI0037F7FF03